MYRKKIHEIRIKDAFTGRTTKTYTKPMQGITVINDSPDPLNITINDITITIKPNEAFSELFDPFTQVTFSHTQYRAYIMG